MKTTCLLLISFAVMAMSCNTQNTDSQQKGTKQIDYTKVQEKAFSELFVEIQPSQIEGSPFHIARDYAVVTAGDVGSFNSMVIGDGLLGRLNGKDVTCIGLRGSRYTLEKILETQTYTISVFDEQFKEQFLLFGQTSGRNSDKMKETTLTAFATPSGNFTYKEARLVIECNLAQTHTINPDEVYATANKTFYEDAYQEVGSYHKIVVGDITHVWTRK